MRGHRDNTESGYSSQFINDVVDGPLHTQLVAHSITVRAQALINVPVDFEVAAQHNGIDDELHCPHSIRQRVPLVQIQRKVVPMVIQHADQYQQEIEQLIGAHHEDVQYGQPRHNRYHFRFFVRRFIQIHL